MSNKMQRRLPLVFVVALAIVLASVMTFSIAGIANADSQKTPTNSLMIGHFSDIHYFPVDDCYQDIQSPDYKTSDFYNSMTGDTKLVMESGSSNNKSSNTLPTQRKEKHRNTFSLRATLAKTARSPLSLTLQTHCVICKTR